MLNSKKPEPTDYTLLWNSLRETISLVKGGKPTPGQGTFGHIAGGYDAGLSDSYGYLYVPLLMQFLSGYYGYTYSLVFAADMYATVFQADPLDPARGQRYRRYILNPGGSQDDIESLKVRTEYADNQSVII